MWHEWGRVGKTDGKGPLREWRCRWEYNIKIGRDGMGEGEDWVKVALDTNVWRFV
jgi:hypothetical protein